MATSASCLLRVLFGVVICNACAAPPPPIVNVPPPVAPPTSAAPASAPPSATPIEPTADAASPAEEALQRWLRKTQCQQFDYFPSGGLQSFWCHRPPELTLTAIRTFTGIDIFASGPHRNDTLDLASSSDFGHYNPAFVRWLVDKGAPSARGSVFQTATQPSYDKNLKPLAEIFWKTLAKARREKECFVREKTAYEDAIKKKKLPPAYYERWFYFMNPYFCDKPVRPGNFYFDNAFDAGVDGNVTKAVVGFWLRRAIDGTMDAFAEGVEKLISSYEPDLLAYAKGPGPDPAAITKAIDSGVKNASRCKDAAAKGPSVHVDIAVLPDGKLSLGPLPTGQNACITAAFAQEHVPTFQGNDLAFKRQVAVR